MLPWFSLIIGICTSKIMSTPLGGGHIIFAFSAVRLPASGRLVSAHLKELCQKWKNTNLLLSP